MSKALLTAFNYTPFLLPTPFYFPNASLTETVDLVGTSFLTQNVGIM